MLQGHALVRVDHQRVVVGLVAVDNGGEGDAAAVHLDQVAHVRGQHHQANVDHGQLRAILALGPTRLLLGGGGATVPGGALRRVAGTERSLQLVSQVSPGPVSATVVEGGHRLEEGGGRRGHGRGRRRPHELDHSPGRLLRDGHDLLHLVEVADADGGVVALLEHLAELEQLQLGARHL